MFYQRLGFVECGRLRRQVVIDGLEDDEIIFDSSLMLRGLKAPLDRDPHVKAQALACACTDRFSLRTFLAMC